MTTQCPLHPHRLLRPLAAPGRGRQCGQCHGLWLSGSLVASVVGRVPRATAGSSPRPALRCPDDGTALRCLRHDGIEIDLCPRCGGVWLDRGELEQLLARREDEHDDGWVEDALDALDAGSEWETSGSRAASSPASALRAKPADKPLAESTAELAGRRSPAAEGLVERPDPIPALQWEPLDAAVPPDTPGIADLATATEAAGDGLLSGAVEGVGDALGAVFEFLGDAFSGL